MTKPDSGVAAGAAYAGPAGSIEHRALLWDAINQYVEACGGEPHRHVYGNTRRQRCVAEIEKLVYQSNNTVTGSEAELK